MEKWTLKVPVVFPQTGNDSPSGGKMGGSRYSKHQTGLKKFRIFQRSVTSQLLPFLLTIKRSRRAEFGGTQGSG